MGRSLPEATVDAWTAIALAEARARYIWLPTPHQGATFGGSHPGDVSSVLGARLVILENKGIENHRAIDFGSDWQAQFLYLRWVEEAGINALQDTAKTPVHGWVFYGLPALTKPVDGSDFKNFPKSHLLVCPHELDGLLVSRSRPLPDFVRLLRAPVRRDLHPVIGPPTSLPVDRLRLAVLGSAIAAGSAGLPVPSEQDSAAAFLTEIVRQARDGMRELRLDLDNDSQLPDGGDVLTLVATLSQLVGAAVPHAAVGLL